METGGIEKLGVPPVFFGFDLGTGGLTGQVRTAEGELLAEASSDYAYGQSLVISDQPKGHMLQDPDRWVQAMQRVSQRLVSCLNKKKVSTANAYVCIAGQMHGLVYPGSHAAPLWCDDRDAPEAEELTDLFGDKVKVFQRMTISRHFGAIGRSDPMTANMIMTPASYLVYKFTGAYVVGVGEASGMFPVNKAGQNFNQEMWVEFDKLVGFHTQLPKLCAAGQVVAALNEYGARMLCLPVGTKVVPPEGDQLAALAGSLIGRPGDAALSLGTSFVLNVLSVTALEGISLAVDPFKTADGKDMSMVWVKNGAMFLDMLMEHYRDVRGDTDIKQTFAAMMPSVEAVAKEYPDCRGLIGLPFLNNEPGAGYDQAGVSMLVGLNADSCRMEHLIHLALLLPLFGIRNGMCELARQGIIANRLILTGGIAHSPSYAGPTIASVCVTDVFIPEVATEGTAYGAYVLALYAYRKESRPDLDFADFLDELAAGRKGQTFKPDPTLADVYDQMRRRFNALRKIGRVIPMSLGDIR